MRRSLDCYSGIFPGRLNLEEKMIRYTYALYARSLEKKKVGKGLLRWGGNAGI